MPIEEITYFLERHGKRVSSLILRNSPLESKELLNIIACCPNLRDTLDLSGSKIEELPPLPQGLKLLNCNNCDSLKEVTLSSNIKDFTYSPSLLRPKLDLFLSTNLQAQEIDGSLSIGENFLVDQYNVKTKFQTEKISNSTPEEIATVTQQLLDKIKQIYTDSEEQTLLSYMEESFSPIQTLYSLYIFLLSKRFSPHINMGPLAIQFAKKIVKRLWTNFFFELQADESVAKIDYNSMKPVGTEIENSLVDKIEMLGKIKEFLNELLPPDSYRAIKSHGFTEGIPQMDNPEDLKALLQNCDSLCREYRPGELSYEAFIIFCKVYKSGGETLARLKRRKSIDFLKSPFGENVCNNFRDDFLDSPTIASYVMEVYPPQLHPELYPLKIETKKHKTFITILAIDPIEKPDAILELLDICSKEYPHKKNTLTIKHYGSNVMDFGGPLRQFFSQTVEGIVKRSSKVHFIRQQDGSFRPAIKGSSLSEEERSHYRRLGLLFGLALREGAEVGRYFSDRFCKLLLAFCRDDLDDDSFSGDEYLKKRGDEDVLKFIEETMELGEAMEKLQMGVKELLTSKEGERVKRVSSELNAFWMNDELAAAIERGETTAHKDEVEAIKNIVRAIYRSHFSAQVEIARTIASGIASCYPPANSSQTNSKWEEIKALESKEFGDLLQGKLSSTLLLESLLFHIDQFASSDDEELDSSSEELDSSFEGLHSNEKIAKRNKLNDVERWIKKWIAEVDCEEKLRRLVTSFTGGSSISSTITVTLIDYLNDIEINTCSGKIAIPLSIGEEELIARLEYYSQKGEEHSFTRY